MKKETDLYILEWEGCNMVGIFRGSDLNQVDNSSKESFLSALKHVTRLYSMDEVKMHFLSSHEELNRLREQRGLESKLVLDEWLKQQGFSYGQIP